MNLHEVAGTACGLFYRSDARLAARPPYAKFASLPEPLRDTRDRYRCVRRPDDLAMRCVRTFTLCASLVIGAGLSTSVLAQTPEPTREGVIEQAQADKVPTRHPYVLTTGEKLMNKVEDITVYGGLHWHPYFESAYHGAGFTLGAGYMHHVSPYNLLDVRGSYSILGYTRVEAEFIAPRLFERRGELSILGGYREATQV